MKKLVLFEFHLLGDAVMSLPFLRAARERYDVYVVCSAVAGRAYELVLPADRIFRMEVGSGKRTGVKEKRQVRRSIRALGAEIGVTVWADVRVHLLMRSLGLKERIGFEMNERNYYAHHMNWRRRNLRIGQVIQIAAKLAGLRPLTRALERRAYRQHHMDDWTQLADALGLTPDFDRPWLGPPGMEIVLPEKARPFFERNAGRKIWLLHPGAARESKRWPHFQELVNTVFSPANIPLVILEDPGVPRIEAAHENCLTWPMSSLADFIALTAHCDRLLCNDSAASHIGAALKKHVITVFGSGSSDWFAPYTKERTVIESFVCPYRPCLDRCVQPRFICLDDIPLGRVTERIAPLLQGKF